MRAGYEGVLCGDPLLRVLRDPQEAFFLFLVVHFGRGLWGQRPSRVQGNLYGNKTQEFYVFEFY